MSNEHNHEAKAAPAVPDTHISVQEAWEAAGGNPGIKASKADLIIALKTLDTVCDEADAAPAVPQGDLIKRVAAININFEKWATDSKQGYCLTREDRGLMATYFSDPTEHAWRGYCAAALAAPSQEPAVPQGWKAVPVEPTQEMMEAMPSMPAIGVPGDMDLKNKGWSLKAIQNRHRWITALAATPAAPSQPVTLTDFDAIDDDVIDAAQESSGMYRVELMRAWNAIVAALREKGAGK